MLPSLKTLLIFLPLISLASSELSNQQSESSAGAQKLVEEEEGVPNAIQESSDGLLPTRRKRSEGV